MIERLIGALLLLVAIALVGVTVRWVNARRDARVIREVSVEPVADLMPRVITFTGDWCTACRTQKVIIDTVVAEWNQPVDVAYVDVLAELSLARQFNVLTVPTTVVAGADGTIAGINRGLVDGDRLRAQLAAA